MSTAPRAPDTHEDDAAAEIDGYAGHGREHEHDKPDDKEDGADHQEREVLDHRDEPREEQHLARAVTNRVGPRLASGTWRTTVGCFFSSNYRTFARLP